MRCPSAMPNPDDPLSPATLYSQAIPVNVLDPEARAAYAAQPLEFKAVNDAILPADEAGRSCFLEDLSAFIRTGVPGSFTAVEENLRGYYLVDIGIGRVSRKIYATHPLMPGKLLVVGGVGIVRPDEARRCLTLETPRPGATLHRTFPDLLKVSMSAGCPTPRKTIESRPNIDPLGGYSLKVASKKWKHSAMIRQGNKGIDPRQFPAVTNVAWGVVGELPAFYVYALPANAVPVCETLQAASREEVVTALQHYLHAGHLLLRALRHLHQAGYMFNQAHQGNVYAYQDEQGEDQIVIADLDTLESIQDFSPKVAPGEWLSPRAFAALVNTQVAASNVAHIAWIDFLRGKLRELHLEQFPGIEQLYAGIIYELLSGYLGDSGAGFKADFYASLTRYFRRLAGQVQPADETAGINRLIRPELYETDVFGFMFTYILMNEDYCGTFGARPLSEGLKRKEEQITKTALARMQGARDNEALARAVNQGLSQVIEERSREAMGEYLAAGMRGREGK
ncbi:MAG: hypothetical protein ACYC6L_06770 [Anaerolineae bacterium]